MERQITQSDFENDPAYLWLGRLKKDAQEEKTQIIENGKHFLKGLGKVLLVAGGLGLAAFCSTGCDRNDLAEREIYNYSKTTTFVPTGRYNGYERIAGKLKGETLRLRDVPLNRMTYHIEKRNNDVPGVNGGNGLIDGNQRTIRVPDYSTVRE